MNASSRLAGLTPQTLAALQESTLAQRRGDAAQAIRSARAAVQVAPEHPEVLRRLALSLVMQGPSDEAAAAIAKAVAQHLDDAVLANAEAIVLRVNGRFDEAIDALRRAHTLQPESIDIALNLGRALRDRGDDEEAARVLGHLVALAPEHRDGRANLAWVLGRLGRADEAIGHYRHLLRSNPGDVRVWSALSENGNVRFDTHDIDALQRIIAAPMTRDDDVRVRFVLGKALEQNERYADAYDNYVRANASIRASRAWNARTNSKEIDDLLRVFDHPRSDSDRARGEGIIFIVSLPRAGSTLVEQILASHPQVKAGDERLDVIDVLGAEGKRRGAHLAAWAAQADGDDWQRLGNSYLERVAPQRGNARVFTDKLPGNWMWLGAVFAMLPGARVVDCRRDALEVAWSCFTQLFADGTQDFSYDFDSIGAFWRDYDRSMRQWTGQYPDRIRTQVYESLLADPETQIRALLDFCGLTFDPACLRFYENPRSVRTLSASQVRRPLMHDTARAQKYSALLDPLRNALFKNP